MKRALNIQETFHGEFFQKRIKDVFLCHVDWFLIFSFKSRVIFCHAFESLSWVDFVPHINERAYMVRSDDHTML